MRVLVAMSGGVDSSVAAARMVDAGYDVVGVNLALSMAAATRKTAVLPAQRAERGACRGSYRQLESIDYVNGRECG